MRAHTHTHKKEAGGSKWGTDYSAEEGEKESKGRAENKLESSSLIMLSHFDVSAAHTQYFYHL